LFKFVQYRSATSGDISGFIYSDANANGTRDAGEQPLRFKQAYADVNKNGAFDVGEPTAIPITTASTKFITSRPAHMSFARSRWGASTAPLPQALCRAARIR